MLGLDHLVDQPGGAGEAYPAFLPAGSDRQAGKEMSLTGATITYKDDRLGFRDVVALSQFVDLLGQDPGIAFEVELLERLHARQAGFAEAPFDQSLFALLQFGLQQ